METTRDPPRDPFQRFLPAPRNPRTSQRLPQRSPPGPQKPPRSATPPQGPQNPPESPRNTPNRPPRSHPGDTSGVRGQGDQAGHCPRAVCTLAAPGTLPKVGSALRAHHWGHLRGPTAVLTCGVRGPGRSPLPWRSGDSEALPAGDSPPERGERLRSTTGTAAGKRPSRGSTSLECPRSPGDGEAGTARRPPRPPPRPSPAGGVSGRWGARGRGPEGPRFSRAARSLEMLSLRSRGSSRECMVPGWALRGTPRGHRRAGGHQCHPEHRPGPAPWQCPLCSGLEDTVLLARRPCRPFRPPCRGPLPQRAKGRAWHRLPPPRSFGVPSVSSPCRRHSLLAHDQTLPGIAKSPGHPRRWSCGVPISHPPPPESVHPSLRLSVSPRGPAPARPFPAAEQGGGGHQPGGDPGGRARLAPAPEAAELPPPPGPLPRRPTPLLLPGPSRGRRAHGVARHGMAWHNTMPPSWLGRAHLAGS